MEGAANTPGFGLVGLGDQGQEIGFFLTEWLLLLFLPQVAVDADITRSLVAAKIEPWKGAINFVFGLELALHTDQTLGVGVDGEFAQIGGDPLDVELFGKSSRCAAALTEVGAEAAFVALAETILPTKASGFWVA